MMLNYVALLLFADRACVRAASIIVGMTRSIQSRMNLAGTTISNKDYSRGMHYYEVEYWFLQVLLFYILHFLFIRDSQNRNIHLFVAGLANAIAQTHSPSKSIGHFLDCPE